jgi:hypothetical protein
LKDWVELLKLGASTLRQRTREAVASVDEASRSALAAAERDKALVPTDQLPVVARLVVEIRSDGTRTVARGAIEDAASGERTAVEARGDTPAQLAAALAGSLVATPLRLGRIAGELVAQRLRKGRP